MSRDREPEFKRKTPRTIVAVILGSTIIGIVLYASLEAFKHYQFVYKPKVISQEIVLSNFDSWMEVVPPEHKSAYEKLRAIASKDHSSPIVYYIIGIKVLEHIGDGKVYPKEAERADILSKLLSGIEDADDKGLLFDNILYRGSPPLYSYPPSREDDKYAVFRDLGAPRLKLEEL